MARRKSRRTSFVPLSIAFVTSFSTALPALAEPRGYQNVSTRVEATRRPYVYYPEQAIYYSPSTSTWFWNEKATWMESPALPAAYQQYTVNGVKVMLKGDAPWSSHAAVVSQYGEPQAERTNHGPEVR